MPPTPEPEPLYPCRECADEFSWPAKNLRVYEGELWCEDCYESCEDDGVPPWSDLPPFVPAHEMRGYVDRTRLELNDAHVALAKACIDRDKLRADLDSIRQTAQEALLNADTGEDLRIALARIVSLLKG